jgi:hypothetical protein
MGYRIYLGGISNYRYDHLKTWMEKIDASYDVIDDELFEFGKYVEWVMDVKEKFGVKDHIMDWFYNDENNIDYDCFTITKEGLEYIIGLNENKVIDYLKTLDDDTKRKNYVDFKLEDWQRGMVINKDLDVDNIVTSWSYEYEIFELLRIYKSFDYKRRKLIIYGW